MPGSAQGIRAGRAFIELFADDAALQKGLRAAEAKLKAFGSAISGIGAQAAAAGVAITVPFLGAAKMFADAGSELADMSARTGLSVEALSQLSHAATQTGTDLATVEGAAKKLQKNAVAAALGSDELTAAFASIGLSAEKLVRLSPDQQFQAVAKAISAIPNPAIKTATAMQLLGKSGTSLLPMIDDFDALTKEARELGLVMSTDDAGAADALGDAMDIVVKVLNRTAVVIGSALAPMLTDVAGVITGIAVDVLDWIDANKPLVQTIFAVGVGLTAAGAAFVALGASISVAGVALGGFATVVGAVGTAFGLLFTPIGLVTAGLAAGVAAFLAYTTAGAETISWLGEQFGALQADAVSAFNGIADALKGGDIALASQILWKSLEIEWLKGVNALNQIWQDWGLAVREVFAGVSTWIAGAMVDVGTSIQATWATVVSELTGSWGSMVERLIKTFAPLLDVIAEVAGIDVSSAIDSALGTGGGEAARKAALDKQLAGIGQSNIDQHAALKDQAAAETEARRRAAADSLAAGAKELADAQAELDQLFGKAADAAAGAESAASPSKPGALAIDLAGIDAGIGVAMKKVDVAGGFNAAAFAGLGIGSSVQDDQLKEQKKQNKTLESINDKLRDVDSLTMDES